jgi:hypothetical protein
VLIYIKVRDDSQSAFNCLAFIPQCRYATKRRATLNVGSAVVCTLLHKREQIKERIKVAEKLETA